MCLIVDKEKFKIETAQEDIVCYKVLAKHLKFVESPYQGFVYDIGKEYKTKIKPHFNCISCTIKEGFHSFLKEEYAWREKMWLEDFCIGYWNLCCFKCIIPKGSSIVYGSYGAKDVVVSEAIKIIEEV